LVLGVILFLLGVSTHAKNDIELRIELGVAASENGLCRSSRAFVFWHSSHPDGNPYNRFNEKNRGFAFECAKSSENGVARTIIGALPTSRDGDSLFWGKGVRYFTPELGQLAPQLHAFFPLLSPLSVGVGGELVLMYYGFHDEVGYNRALSYIPMQLQPLAMGKLQGAREGFVIAPLPIGVMAVRYRLPHGFGHLTLEQRYLAGKAKLYGFGWSRDF
jgi:hypothetical protein